MDNRGIFGDRLAFESGSVEARALSRLHAGLDGSLCAVSLLGWVACAGAASEVSGEDLAGAALGVALPRVRGWFRGPRSMCSRFPGMPESGRVSRRWSVFSGTARRSKRSISPRGRPRTDRSGDGGAHRPLRVDLAHCCLPSSAGRDGDRFVLACRPGDACAAVLAVDARRRPARFDFAQQVPHFVGVGDAAILERSDALGVARHVRLDRGGVAEHRGGCPDLHGARARRACGVHLALHRGGSQMQDADVLQVRPSLRALAEHVVSAAEHHRRKHCLAVHVAPERRPACG